MEDTVAGTCSRLCREGDGFFKASGFIIWFISHKLIDTKVRNKSKAPVWREGGRVSMRTFLALFIYAGTFMLYKLGTFP